MDSYEGLRAGEAIVAVRERGLRPSLERIEGAAPDVHGFVVSQEPVAGSEVPAESQVFLYIGAPARTVRSGAPPVEESAEEPVEERWDEDGPGGDEYCFAETPTQEHSVGAGHAGDGPADEDPVDAEFVDDEAGDEGEDEWFEEAEPTRVWRGPAPEAARRGGPRRGERAEGSQRRSVPVGVKVAAIGLVACLALTVLLSLATRFEGGGAGRRSEARRGSFTTGRSGGGADGHGAATRKAAAHRSVRHGRGGGLARGTDRPRTVVVVVRVPVPAPVAVPVARGPSASERGPAETAAAEQLHVEREFGP